MAKQVWGTFSVKDHTLPGAFATEVMVYDRLVIPVPPDDEERARWETMGWQPTLLDERLKILGDRAIQVDWDADRRKSWKSTYEAGKAVAAETPDYAFAATRTLLTAGLPNHVTGVQSVPSFSSLQDATDELGIRPTVEGEMLPGGAAVTILAHKFLVPKHNERNPTDALRAAVDIASDRSYRRKRAAFWRWLREFYDDQNMCHPAAIQDALEEMEDLLEEQRAIVRKSRVKTYSKYAFVIGGTAAAAVAAGPAALALTGVFASFGGFLSDRLVPTPDQPREVALLHDIQRHFGWKEAD